MKITWKSFLKLRTITIAAILTVLAFNIFYLFVNIKVLLANRHIAIYEPGYQFHGFKERLQDVKKVGYLTNKDMSPEHNDGEFLQAQYVLAPIVLELNNPTHKLNILDYTDQIFLFYSLRRLKAAPIYDTEYSKVLAIKKQ